MAQNNLKYRSIFLCIWSRAFNQVRNIRNKLLKQGHFWPFAPRQLVGVTFCLISSFQLNLANLYSYYFQNKNLRCLPINRYKNRWSMVQIKHFTTPHKIPNFQFSRSAKQPWRDKVLSALQRGQKIIVNQSKPILGCLHKAFYLPEFRAKLFFTRNGLGTFY